MTQIVPTKVSNPYWDSIREFVYADHCPWGTEYQVDVLRLPNSQYRDLRGDKAETDRVLELNRHNMVKKYSWTIPDPATLEFVVKHCDGPVLDPLAGTGYWANLLSQHGIDVIASDLAPGTNHWHQDAELHYPIFEEDALDAVKMWTDRILIMSWIPYGSDLGEELLKCFPGNKIVYIGELEGGCCGTDEMFERLNEFWVEKETHSPIQWSGIHDFVAVYERKAIAS